LELTTKGRYAVMAMADLASRSGAQAVPLSQIAERQNLPVAYLEQLFVALRRANLVESERGRSGGYRLARLADDINVSDVMSAVEEGTRFTRCSDTDVGCTKDKPCLAHGLWTALGDSTTSFLSSVTLADVVSGKISEGKRRMPAPSGASRAPVYLDYNATAPLLPAAKAAMVSALDCIGNPSSVHAEGRKARGVIEAAREQVAALVGAKPSEVVFTSGASEANAWVMAQPWDTIVTSRIEHDSVQAPARAKGCQVIDIPVSADGTIAAETIAEILGRTAAKNVLLAVQLANNETGVVQDVASIAQLARQHGALVHTDAVQAASRIAVDFETLGAATMSLSAHKLGGPKGVGALIVRDRLDLVPLIRGGGQERRRRAGTENVAAIAGFGVAAAEAANAIERASATAALRDRLEAAVRETTPKAVVIGSDALRLANTSCFALPGKHSETLVIRLDMAGIAVSAGAACSSGKVGTSHVLEAMGLPREVAASAIRVSLGPNTRAADVDRFIAAWKDIAGTAELAA